MAHAQNPDFVFRRNGRVHLNRRGCQFSRLLAAEVCASAVVMLSTPCSEVEWKSTGYPLHSPVSPSPLLPCVTVCHHISTGVYPSPLPAYRSCRCALPPWWVGQWSLQHNTALFSNANGIIIIIMEPFTYFDNVALFIISLRPCPYHFLARSQNCEKRLSASSCLSVCPSPASSSQLPPDGLSWHLIFDDFFRKSVKNSKFFFKSDKNNGYFT
jgi:hypothetical protein